MKQDTLVRALEFLKFSVRLSGTNSGTKSSLFRMAKMMSMKMSSMKMGMKKMAMKKSIIARGKKARLAVWRGKAKKTGGGLTKSDLKKNKSGKIVAVKHSACTKKKHQWKGAANPWSQAVQKARNSLGVQGFLAVGGKSAAGKQLLAKVRSLYKK